MDETARSAPGIALTAALLALSMAPTRLAATLKSDRASRADLDRMERGYYERILDRRSVGGPESARSHTPFAYGRLAVAVDDWREYVLKADLHTDHRGASWSTNALGLRDREYAASRPEKTVRLALVGDSIGAGWGVDDGSGFEPILEGELDARSRSRGGPDSAQGQKRTNREVNPAGQYDQRHADRNNPVFRRKPDNVQEIIGSQEDRATITHWRQNSGKN